MLGTGFTGTALGFLAVISVLVAIVSGLLLWAFKQGSLWSGLRANLFFVVIGLPIFLVAGIVVKNVIGGVTDQRFTSPSGNRILKIIDDCSYGNACFARASLSYRHQSGWRQMKCEPLSMGKNRREFAKYLAIDWQSDENIVRWQSRPDRSGKIDLRKDCAHVAATTVLLGLKRTRFGTRENCLGERCWRTLWLEMRVTQKDGRFLYAMPCAINQAPQKLMFSDGRGGSVITARWAPDKKRIHWQSSGPYRGAGVVDINADCDRSKERKRPSPF